MHLPQLFIERIRNVSTLVTVTASLVMGLTRANATSLLLDFGPTTVVTADTAKSPGHFLGVVPAGEISWNKVTGDSSALVYGDGTTATGVSIDVGIEGTGTPGVIDLSNNGFNNTTGSGTSINSGIYSGTSPMRDFIFGLNPNNHAVGFQIGGLPAGTYTLYLVGRIGNSSSADPQRFYVTNGPAATTFPFSLNSLNAPVSNPSPVNSATYVEGNNYAVITNTLATGDSLFVACANDGTGDARGFLSCVEVAFPVAAPSTNLPAKITLQPTPASATINEGVTVTFSAAVSGTEPITRQWLFNGTNLSDGPNISGSGTNTLTLFRATASQAGTYSLSVSNLQGTDLSSNVVLTVNSLLNTAQMTNIWNLLPGERPYLSTNSTERGLAFDSLTTNLLLVSRNVSNQIVVLDGATGTELRFLNVSATSGGTFVLNTVGVADDGVVYATGLTTAASASNPLKIYRWNDDSGADSAETVFIGDPAGTVQPGLRWGDVTTVRGAGANTQILLSPSSGTNVVLLQTIDSQDFETEIPPLVIAISNVPSAFAERGLAFGPGTNTFWAKNFNGNLYLVQFDINSGTGFVLQTFTTAQVPVGMTGLAMDQVNNLLAGVAIDPAGDHVCVYDVSSLAAGAVLRDQETFEYVNSNSQEANSLSFGDNYLFALDSNNGIKAFQINPNYVPPSGPGTISVISNPGNVTTLAGRSATFSAAASSPDLILYQWRFNGTNLTDGPYVTGSTSNILNLSNLTTNNSGNYSMFVTNVDGSATSSNAVLTVVPTYNTSAMTNIWTLLPGQRDYLNTSATERSLAYNPVTTNLLIATRTPTARVAVLDATTGAQKSFLNTAGVSGGTYDLDQIAVADDGVIIGANLTTAAKNNPLVIYRWADDSSNSVPTVVFIGDPAAVANPNLRWGDTLVVRGSGTNTQILLSPSSGTNVVLLTSASGLDFQNEIPPLVIPVTGVLSGFAQKGVAFGPGSNTFWGQNTGAGLYLIQVDSGTGLGSVIYSNLTTLPAAFSGVATDPSRRLLAGLSFDTAGDSVYLYNVTDLSQGTVLADQEAFVPRNANSLQLSAFSFGGNYLFALDANNGVMAFEISPLPLAQFPLSNVSLVNGSIVFACSSVAGHNYQVQYRDSLPGAGWTNMGSSVVATGSSLSFTNLVSGTGSRFFRVQSQ